MNDTRSKEYMYRRYRIRTYNSTVKVLCHNQFNESPTIYVAL